ncbi:hypothetical protein CFD26_103344 [Aspergillus turcosus]|uniref:Glycoside hydrolase family 43 protein n=1 Tax=Aspergillus turcosus TaxID=1245748 RepID=A0A421CY01_9EURO|nr:hypothetical protein CFD26_103344 [Aspergillus turcosus]
MHRPVFCLLGLHLSSTFASIIGPVITANFPDPSVIQVEDGDWYAFATNNGVYNVQIATSHDFENWTVLNQDALPDAGVWSDGTNVWAPDVREIDNTFVMYYAATIANGSTHCVGAATSKTVTGPYTPQDSPIACPVSQGGAIDPSGFVDTTGEHWLVYKIDGNSLGHGGNCNNGIPPLTNTPIMLQRMSSDGLSAIGSPTKILDRGVEDGPLVEAPSLVKVNGVYVLFYSRNCYAGPWYVVAHATSKSITGPYTKARNPDISTGFGPTGTLYAPGGMTVTADGKRMVFHADLGTDVNTRQMYIAYLDIIGGQVIV